jgi:hypothetical protein
MQMLFVRAVQLLESTESQLGVLDILRREIIVDISV